MLWINFLHLYQPANSDAHVIEEAIEKSYSRIVRALEEHPKIKFTLNIQGCLILRWEEMGYEWLIKKIDELIKKGQVELTGTCAFHPLMPLISAEEVESQIKTNEKILKKHFGKNFKPKGFFLPEMAYSKEVAKIIKKNGYKWIILDEIAKSGKLKNENLNNVFEDKESSLSVVFRNRELSQNYVPDILRSDIHIQRFKNKENIYITATDGELYGLRHIDHTAEFEKLLDKSDLKTQTISEYIEGKTKEKTSIVPCSWESTEKELERKLPYALWLDPKNKIQKKLWELANLTYDTIKDNPNDENIYWVKWHFVRGLASCTFWWASARDLKLFSGISWSPDEIERGINEFIRALRAFHDEDTRKTKIKAEKLYIKIKQMIWDKHWNYYWKK